MRAAWRSCGVLVAPVLKFSHLLVQFLKALLVALDKSPDGCLGSGRDLVPQFDGDRRNGRHTNVLRPLAAWTSSAGEWVRAILSVPGSQLLDEPGQRLTHRFERVGIVGVVPTPSLRGRVSSNV
jgi:hypothetical protein